MDKDLCFTGARKLAQLIRTRKVSAAEAMRAYSPNIGERMCTAGMATVSNEPSSRPAICRMKPPTR